MHLCDYFVTPDAGDHTCKGCDLPGYRANPPLKPCSNCQHAFFCSTACSVKNWSIHKLSCSTTASAIQEEELIALANPREALLGSKLRNFTMADGFIEIGLAVACQFHLSHPSRPHIHKTHILEVFLEFDPKAIDMPLRLQGEITRLKLSSKEEFSARNAIMGGDDGSNPLLTSGRALYADSSTGSEDVEATVLINATWKGDPFGDNRGLRVSHNWWVKRAPPGTEREYEDIIADHLPFIQRSLKEPPLSFRHLFDRKIDLATRSFDFRERENNQLPPRDSPGYEAAREAMFKLAERSRDGRRQYQSYPENAGADGYQPIFCRLDMKGNLDSIKFNNGREEIELVLKQEEDVMDGVRRAMKAAQPKGVKKQKKDLRKKEKREREMREKEGGDSVPLTIDVSDLD